MKKKTAIAHKYDEQIERQICDLVSVEYDTSKTNNRQENVEFEQVIDILECRRTEKEYDWMSDVFIPEYPAIHLTEMSGIANQYFQSRDFVEVYLEGDRPEQVKMCDAAKKLINKTLNNKELYHYQKYMRANSIKSTAGVVYALCWWEQEVAYDGTVKYDRFNYEVLDPRNVFTDNSYCYTLQDKKYIIIRSEKSYEDLLEDKDKMKYFNLDLVKDLSSIEETDTSRESYNKDEKKKKPSKRIFKDLDVLERYGKVWAIVKEKDEIGIPTAIEPGTDREGNILDDAELVETVVTEVYSGSSKILVRFEPQRNISSKGIQYRPVIRGICYIHPTKDIGMSGGKYSRELQVAINDTVNMSNDRVQLATFPTIQVKRLTLEDNDTIYFEPEHPMIVENIGDIAEFKIQSDIGGAMNQYGIFKNSMQQVEATYPTTMGDVGKASTTATAVAGAESRTNLRSNYKSLTFEYTFNADFYWMILQMAKQYMLERTAALFLGEDAFYFDPEPDYTYAPLTSNVEMEYNKNNKVKNYDQILGRISGLAEGNPKVMPIIAHILSRQLQLMGDEYQTISKMLNELSKSVQQGKGEDIKDAGQTPTSNQSGQPMSLAEQGARNDMSGGTI